MKKRDDINPRVVIWQRLTEVSNLLEKAKIPREVARMKDHYPEYKKVWPELIKKWLIVAKTMDEMIELVDHEVTTDDAQASIRAYLNLVKLLDRVAKEIPSGNPSEKKQILAAAEKFNKAHNYAWGHSEDSSRVDWKKVTLKKLEEGRKLYRGLAFSSLPGASVAKASLKEFEVLFAKFSKEVLVAFEN